jgi:hypothetical protein
VLDVARRETPVPATVLPRRTRLWALAERRWAVAAVAVVVVASVTPTLAGYLAAPSGWKFTGAIGYGEDLAQHEVWAEQMAQHGRYLVNVLTPEPTRSGWFFSPFELVMGLLERVTGLPYAVINAGLAIATIPLLTWGLLTLARRAGISPPGPAVVLALVAGSFAPVAVAASNLLGLPGDKPIWLAYSGDATPAVAGVWIYLTLAVLTLVALTDEHVVRGFRRAGAILFVLGAVYPFFLPTLFLTTGLYAASLTRSVDRRTLLKGLVWFGLLSLPPTLYYALLPHYDPEFAHFARLNHRPLPTLTTTIVSLGFAAGAVIGVPRLVRGNRTQQLLGCLAVAVVVAVYIPQHPWRSHLFYLTPPLVVGALAAWWPVVQRWRWRPKRLIIAAALAAALTSTPYNYVHAVRAVQDVAPPQYLAADDVAAIDWLDRRPGMSVVLAASDISPWVAARAGHRVLVGHYLWTHDYRRRRDQVDAVFHGRRSPRSLIAAFRVRWILLDARRKVPAWAQGVKPVARFNQASVLRAADVLERS